MLHVVREPKFKIDETGDGHALTQTFEIAYHSLMGKECRRDAG